MELSYNSKNMRAATLDAKAAQNILGDDLARSFHSLIADMRDAVYLGELPDVPVVVDGARPLQLNYPLGSSALLMVKPIDVGEADGRDWRSAHRVQLLGITSEGKVLI